jgi:glycosyltransferase involved in cell wall biosynthesis
VRALFLSNYYPPHARGGYELWCEEVAAELTARGHQICIVTSATPGGAADGVQQTNNGTQVHRVLHLEVESGLVGSIVRLLIKRDRLERENLAQLRAVVENFQPDVALIWGMWNMPRSVAALVEDLLGKRVCYYLCDYWPSLPSAYLQQWQAPALRSLSGMPKQILGRPIRARLARLPRVQLRFDNPICVSEAVRDELVARGLPFAHARIIYGGTRVREFTPRDTPSHDGRDGQLRVLYAGRVTPTKGVHTAIRAFEELARRNRPVPVVLDIVGGGDAVYERELRDQVATSGLESRVHFRGGVSRAEMPRVLQDYDALLLLSEWQEPFARVVLEAMATGLVVIGTTTGGTGEILIENETGLTFPAGDYATLARQIQRIAEDLELRKRLAQAGRRTVERSFTFRRMVDELEQALTEVSAGG